MAIYSKLIEDLNNGDEMFVKVFTVNPNGRVNNRADLPFASCVPMEGVPLSEFADRTIIMIRENGVAIPYYLAKHDYESDLNGTGRVLMVRKECHSERLWSNNTANTYTNQALDTFLNYDFISSFSTKVQKLISSTKYRATTGYGSGLVTLERSVFMMSVTEMGKSYTTANVEGSALPSANSYQKATCNGVPVSQWTRTPMNSNGTSVFFWTNDGTFASTGPKTTGVYCRPIFTLPSSALIKIQPNADGSYDLID